MADTHLLSPDTLRQLLNYNPDTGLLIWKPRPENTTGWNARHAGKPALTGCSRGYKVGTVNGITVKAHRVIWAMVNNVWPNGDIDHINGEPSDNRIENLRCVTHHQNTLNQSMRPNNTSGVMGVCWDKNAGKWHVKIMVNGRNKYIGLFSSIDDAADARRKAEVLYGYHSNHGRPLATK